MKEKEIRLMRRKINVLEMAQVSLKHKLETNEARKGMEMRDLRAQVEREMRKEAQIREFNMKQMFEKELAHLWFENDKIKHEFDMKDLLVSKLS